MIAARALTKRYGATLAVEGLTFDVLPGRVTGFLGPNGAGKSTTMRLILVGQRILATKGLETDLGGPNVIRSVIGAGLYLVVVGLLGLGIGAIIHWTAGAIAVVVALMFILPGVVGVLPTAWQTAVTGYLPSNAGQALIGHTRFAAAGARLLGPWTGLGVFCAYAVAVLIVSAMLLDSRDT